MIGRAMARATRCHVFKRFIGTSLSGCYPSRGTARYLPAHPRRDLHEDLMVLGIIGDDAHSLDDSILAPVIVEPRVPHHAERPRRSARQDLQPAGILAAHL